MGSFGVQLLLEKHRLSPIPCELRTYISYGGKGAYCRSNRDGFQKVVTQAQGAVNHCLPVGSVTQGLCSCTDDRSMPLRQRAVPAPPGFYRNVSP